ncbi:MAG: hypothetical protein M3P24_08435, partial [Gemmatimonadota bacterium]|nr:hypothetical protein [Gemmatimonadota bacterium]
LTVVLRRRGMGRAGFQMTARHAEGEAPGAQAGTLRALDERVAVVSHQGTLYAQHTASGSQLSGGDTAVWRVEWTAPPAAAGAVVFHLAGNAADGDGSQLGDHVYTATASVTPPRTIPVRKDTP